MEDEVDTAGRPAKRLQGVELSWVQGVAIDKSAIEPPTPSYWNHGVETLRNGLSSILHVANHETRDFRRISPGASQSPQWFLPWCYSYDEVVVKALEFRALPPTTPWPFAWGSRLFYVFQDYGSDQPMWLPAGVANFGFREPIETAPGSNTYIEPCSYLELSAVVDPENGLIVPGGAEVVA